MAYPTMSFDLFLETLDHVPPEFERNFNLIKDLDQSINDNMPKINILLESYKAEKRRSVRLQIRREIAKHMDKVLSYSDDKIELAERTYDLVDKNIKHLINIGTPQDSEMKPQIQIHMPVDPNEPKYCICRDVSHGEMVACDNPECLYEWFHPACVNLVGNIPEGTWYCPECQKIKNEKKNANKSKRRKPKRHY